MRAGTYRDKGRYSLAFELRILQKRTLKDTGYVLGVSVERARQMVLKAQRMIKAGELEMPTFD